MPPDASVTHIAARILLAEDDPENRALATRILEKAGYKVQAVIHGREAAEVCEDTFFDAILMDIQMPVMDGFCAAERIRAKGKNRLAPIIAFTALSGDTVREQCRQRGMDDFLAKPSKPAILVELISSWILRRPVVLVVDDSKDSRALIRRHLKDFRTLFAKNGVEAIAAVRDSRVSLILMDMEMPVMDGYTAARAIAALLPSRPVPIIAMTSHEGDREVSKCLQAGCADFIQKPVNARLLGHLLDRYLPGHREGNGPGDAPGQPDRHVVSIDPDLREIIPDFLDHRRNDIVEIRRLFEAGDFPEILRIGHSMKGSGGGYGFPDISAVGAKIETAARSRDAKKILLLTKRLEDYLETVSVVYREKEKAASEVRQPSRGAGSFRKV